jgi:hypothetical protein
LQDVGTLPVCKVTSFLQDVGTLPVCKVTSFLQDVGTLPVCKATSFLMMNAGQEINIKVKGKVYPRTSYQIPEGAVLFL